MNTAGTIAHADRARTRRPASTGSRASSTRTPIPPRWCAYADLVLPDTTYLERWDCISLLDRPISSADGPADAIRQPVVAARPRRAAVPGRAARSRRAARPCRAWSIDDGAPQFPSGYADYIVHHERRPGHRPARRLARRGRRARRAAARPTRQLSATSRTAASGRTTRARSALLQARQPAPIWSSRAQHGLHRARRADHVPALQRGAAEIPAGRARATAPCSRRRATARASRTYFDPLPFWYPPFEDAADDRSGFPVARHHPAADGDVSLLGLA